ncbi:hypothetical protein [Hoylesella loescheii]|uniref:Lipoprotein n=2 Tax=Hoylesella loescheii TaxID=840 RepID=A0A069QHK9_HOYLO|nr:hypothetical protein [Hoylesella loescheii]KDR52348.1 hypothetical protein HMPREF1991_01530 [Hoylesella loescheii DSM 19665 = JCM 12249 = ATCC 15930]
MAKKMIRTILAIGLLAVLVGCEPKPFKGIIVCKEYVKAHMDNEEAHVVEEAMFVPRVHYVPRPRRVPQLVPSEWKLYVANKYAVRVFYVDSITYTRHRVGERITMKQK